MTNGPRYLRAAALARELDVSVRTVRRRIADGTFPSVKIGGSRLVEALERLLGGFGDDHLDDEAEDPEEPQSQ